MLHVVVLGYSSNIHTIKHPGGVFYVEGNLLYSFHMKQTTFAGFWLRLIAFIIDVVIVSSAGWVLGFVLGFAYVSAVGSAVHIGIVANGIGHLGMWLYFAGYESSRHQATIGKRIVGIRVTDSAFEQISFGRATARYFAKALSVLTLGIGFLMIAVTKQRQGLHDRIAKTLVVR